MKKKFYIFGILSLFVLSSLISTKVSFASYSHTSNHNVTDTQQVTVPAGKRAYVDAYALHRKTTFELWDSPLIGSDRRVGTGESFRSNGVRLQIVIN